MNVSPNILTLLINSNTDYLFIYGHLFVLYSNINSIPCSDSILISSSMTSQKFIIFSTLLLDIIGIAVMIPAFPELKAYYGINDFQVTM